MSPPVSMPETAATVWPFIVMARVDSSRIVLRLTDEGTSSQDHPGLWHFSELYTTNNSRLPHFLTSCAHSTAVRLINHAGHVSSANWLWQIYGRMAAFFLFVATVVLGFVAGATHGVVVIVLARLVGVLMGCLCVKSTLVASRCSAQCDALLRHVLRELNDTLQEGGGEDAEDRVVEGRIEASEPESLCSVPKSIAPCWFMACRTLDEESVARSGRHAHARFSRELILLSG